MREKRILEKLLNILLDIFIGIFGVILLITVYNSIQTKVFKNDYSKLFGYSTFEVVTGSMAPTIEAGDYIIVKYTNDIKLNDIVTYKKNDDFITHRVREKYNDIYVTKGDANNTKDDAINKSQIVGKVVKILPGFGNLRKTILNPFVLITLIVTLYIISYIAKDNKDKKNKVLEEIFAKAKIIINKLVSKFNTLKEKKVTVGVRTVDVQKEEAKEEVKTKQVLEVIEERVIESTPSLEIDEEEDEEDDDEEEVEPPQMDMEQTMFFRMVSVNKNDVDGAYNTKSNKKIEVITEDANITEEEIESKSEEEINKTITNIQKKKKKFKNGLEKIMYIKEDEISSIVDVLNRKEKFKNNESTINDALLRTYMYARYYGSTEDGKISFTSKNVLTKVNDAIKEKATLMVEIYKGSDKTYEDKVNKFMNYYMLINNLEVLSGLYKDIASKRENYKNKVLQALRSELTSGLELMDIVNKIIIIQKVHNKIINNQLDKSDSNIFTLNIESIGKNLYGAKLNHNINFSKVYSDYIVDRTYNEGVIADEKTVIMIMMLTSVIARNMFEASFEEKYFINIPGSVYSKRNKLDKIITMLDDDALKESVVIVNDYDDIISNKKVIKDLKKQGFHFAVAFNKESSIKAKDSGNLALADYVIADNETIKSIKLMDALPKELQSSVIKENAYNKIID